MISITRNFKAAIKRHPRMFRIAVSVVSRIQRIGRVLSVQARVASGKLLEFAIRASLIDGRRPWVVAARQSCWASRVQYTYVNGDLQFHRGRLGEALQQWRLSDRIRTEALRALESGTDPDSPCELTSGYWTCAIGHMALMDGVVKLSRLGLLPHRALRLHLKPDLVANRPYLDLFDRHMTFVDYPVSSMERSRLTLTEQKLNMIRTTVGPLFVYQACALAEQRWLEQRLPPVLTLPPAYRDLARAKLTPLGLRDDRWFVTLHLRGSRYRAEPADVTRNASLSAYSLAIRQIVDAGGQVVLLGEPGMDVPRGLASILVDYANHPRRDPRIDLFLCSDCRFFLGTSSGISHVPGTFGVPAIFSNVSPAFSRPWRRGDIWLPKMLLSNITGRPLRLADLMTPPVSMLGNFSAQKAIGVTAVDNDPEDVCCAVEDMLERLENPLRTPLDDIQERCRKLLSISGYESSLYASQISARFARRHAAALEI